MIKRGSLVLLTLSLAAGLAGETITTTGMSPAEGVTLAVARTLAKKHAMNLATEQYCATHLTGIRLTTNGILEKFLSTHDAPAPSSVEVVSEESQGKLLKVTIRASFPAAAPARGLPPALDFPPATWKNLRVALHTEEKYVTQGKIFLDHALKRYLLTLFLRRGADAYPLGAPSSAKLLEEARKKGTHFLLILKEATKKTSEGAPAVRYLSSATLWWYEVPSGLRVFSQKVSAAGQPDIDDRLALKNTADRMREELQTTLDSLLGPASAPGQAAVGQGPPTPSTGSAAPVAGTPPPGK